MTAPRVRAHEKSTGTITTKITKAKLKINLIRLALFASFVVYEI
jgi:hypothetical protein